MVELVRSVALDRLTGPAPRGAVSDDVMDDVLKRLKVLVLLGRRSG